VIDSSLRKPLSSRILRLAFVLCSALIGTLAVAGPASAASTGAVAWGANGAGQLGDGNETGPEDCYPGYPEPCSIVPVALRGLSEAKSVVAGGVHALALLNDGMVMAWGGNGAGQLGDGTTTASDVPVAVSGLSEVTQITAGEASSFGLLKGGTVMSWGDNEYGELGNFTMRRSTVPVAVSGVSEVMAIAAGSDYVLALLKDGTVMAWGANGAGQLGDGSTEDTDVPVAVSGLSEVVAIAASRDHSLALLRDGTVMAWGGNGTGQLGDGTTTASDVPVAVSGISEATAVAAGELSSFALLRDGTVMSWGANEPEEGGELGDGTETSSDVPVAVCAVGEQAPCAQHLSGVAAIAAGYRHTLALLGNGTVVAWGAGSQGQLGDGYLDVASNYAILGSDAPVAVDGLSEATAISAGERFSLAIGMLAPLPTVTKLDPESGPANGGTSVRITGSNFTGVTAVRFGSTAANFTVDSETEITAVAPPGTGMDYVTLPGAIVTPSGTIYVTVQTAAGRSPASTRGDLFAYGSPETEASTGGGQSGGLGASSGLAGSVLGVNAPGQPAGESVTHKVLTRVQKLAKALKRCEKYKSKIKRVACQKLARRKYATTARKIATGRQIRAGQ
jgi:alpha-tubulin suppressor-like RCC1 family protein